MFKRLYPPSAPAPDADGVGTDTASIRAKQFGNEAGRVYKITFLAIDEIGEPAEGTYRSKCRTIKAAIVRALTAVRTTMLPK